MYTPVFKSISIDRDPHFEEGSITIDVKLTVREIAPSERKYTGIIQRYFAMHRSDKRILEINQNTYRSLESKDTNFDFLDYIITKINWDTTSPKSDTMQGKYLLEGSNTKNLRAVEKVEKTMPGLKDYLILKGELYI